jgi:enoyl-CoA hydratase
MSSETVLCEVAGPVAVVRLNRPEKHHAMNREMSAALEAVMQRLDADPEVRAVVLTGTGERAFCAGHDLTEGGERSSEAPAEPQERHADGIGAVVACSKPVIAAIKGYAFGGGARLALAADIRLAAPSARIRFVAAAYGTVACTVSLPLLIGPARAKELIYTTRIVEPDEAERIGLINTVVREGDVVDAAVAMANEIAGSDPAALYWSKKVIDTPVIDEARALEKTANAAISEARRNNKRLKEATQRATGQG